MTTLNKLVTIHHDQARHIARQTFAQDPSRNVVQELKRVGSRFTTRVERRLRKMEMTHHG